ncbi:MAG: sensor domain-containing diguanylate cyclase, partial [Cyanobacteria bacterium P01_F01_bin.4]
HRKGIETYSSNRVLDKVNAVTQDLAASRARMLAILNAPAFPVVISRVEDSRVHFINQRAAELFGFTLQESGRYPEIDFWENLVDRERFLSKLEIGQPVSDFEAHLKRTDQTTFWSLISGIYLDYEGEDCILFSFNDISNRKITEDKLRRLAHTDSLTGTYNRRFFLQLAGTALIDCQLKAIPATALMLDIDHFKHINDTYGHATGDLAIKFVANISARHLRDSDVLGRFGGEEFSILLPTTALKGAMVIAERIRKSIEERALHHQGQSIKFTVSIGVAQAGLEDGIHDLLDQADQALYQAKKLGRNRVEHLLASDKATSES